MNLLFLCLESFISDHSLVPTWKYKTSRDPTRLVSGALWMFLVSFLKEKIEFKKNNNAPPICICIWIMYSYSLHSQSWVNKLLIHEILQGIIQENTANVHTFSVMWLNFHHALLVQQTNAQTRMMKSSCPPHECAVYTPPNSCFP